MSGQFNHAGKATGWQNHTIRGFISGTVTKKMDERRYNAALLLRPTLCAKPAWTDTRDRLPP